MTVINVQKLKNQYKAALKSGKIVYVGSKVHHVDLEFRDYLIELNNKEWSYFEEKEYCFRKSIASRKINYGDFCCKGNIILWEKVTKYLSSMFYKCKTFLYKKKINEPRSTQFIKFCCPIDKSFPIDLDINDNLNKSSIEFLERQLSKSSIEFLERQLYCITKTIRSYFSVNQNTNSNNEQSVSREKLTDIWLNKRKKAINIIKNNSKLAKVE